jgi:hypothetical protein
MTSFQLRAYFDSRETTGGHLVLRTSPSTFVVRAVRVDRDEPDPDVTARVHATCNGKPLAPSRTQAHRSSFPVDAPRYFPVRLVLSLQEVRGKDSTHMGDVEFLIVPAWSAWVARPACLVALLGLTYLGWLLANIQFASLSFTSWPVLAASAGVLGPAALVGAAKAKFEKTAFLDDWRWGLGIALGAVFAGLSLTQMVQWLHNTTDSPLEAKYGNATIKLEKDEATLVPKSDDLANRLEDPESKRYCISNPNSPECPGPTNPGKSVMERLLFAGVAVTNVSCRSAPLPFDAKVKLEQRIAAFDTDCRPKDGTVTIAEGTKLTFLVSGSPGATATYKLGIDEGLAAKPSLVCELKQYTKLQIAASTATSAIGLNAELRGDHLLKAVSVPLTNNQGLVITPALSATAASKDDECGAHPKRPGDYQLPIAIERAAPGQASHLGDLDCFLTKALVQLSALDLRGTLQSLSVSDDDRLVSRWSAKDASRNVPAFVCLPTAEKEATKYAAELDFGGDWQPSTGWRLELPVRPQTTTFYGAGSRPQGQLTCDGLPGPVTLRVIRTSRAVQGVSLQRGAPRAKEATSSSWAAAEDADSRWARWVFVCEDGSQEIPTVTTDAGLIARWTEQAIEISSKAGKTCRAQKFAPKEPAPDGWACSKPDSTWDEFHKEGWVKQGCETVLACTPRQRPAAGKLGPP